jgi:hypothetical protein
MSITVYMPAKSPIIFPAEQRRLAALGLDKDVDALRRWLTVLRKDQSKGSSYLELAQFLRQAGDPAHIDDVDNRPDLGIALSTASFYGLNPDQAQNILSQVLTAVGTWRDSARQLGITQADIVLTEAAFSALPP